MEGQFALPVVVMSYLVAVLAAYTALEMAGKVMRPGTRPGLWLLAGSLAMGTGIWSMHFIGMEAFSLPIEVVYDAPLTFLSWIAAVLVSALALWSLTLLRRKPDSPDPRIVIPAGMVMGAGICIMHYSGMTAMRMSPGIDYDPILVAASGLIAVAASIVTLLIAARLREVKTFQHLLMRIGAAMIMGVAIAGMHYTGMFAASFAPDAVCMTTSGLATGWTIGPVTFATLAILASALVLSVGDSRAIRQRRLIEHRRSEIAQEKAFMDSDSGLPNRSWLNRQLSDSAVLKAQNMSLVTLECQRDMDPSDRRIFGRWLREAFPEAQAVSLQPETFGLLFYGQTREPARQRVLNQLESRADFRLSGWKVGAAACPEDTQRLFRLVPRARASAEPLQA
jgi:diguanylate cyclase